MPIVKRIVYLCAQSFFFVDIFFDGRFLHSLFVVLKLIQHTIVGIVFIG